MDMHRLSDSSLAALAASCDVLLVDDNEVNLQLAVRRIAQFGYTVTTAMSGREAIERVALQSFRIILMDYQMPDIDGLEATRRIRASESATDYRVPIIGLSANVENSVRHACLAAGMDEFLELPIASAALQITLSRWLGEPRIGG